MWTLGIKRLLHLEDRRCRRLVMTLLLRDEEEIVERNIRSHAAMGVDGFIVTLHRSTDRTDEILERLRQERLVLEIIRAEEREYLQSKWVGEMVRIARDRHGADWVMHADADEFYYADCQNLKDAINRNLCANVLWVDSTFFLPDDSADFFKCPWFVTRPMSWYEAEKLGVADNPRYREFIGSLGCVKVIHTTRGFRSIRMGNHGVEMKHARTIHCADIRLYHYHVRNYIGYEEKIRRYADSIRRMPGTTGRHMKRLLDIYERGELRQEYDGKFTGEVRDFLIRNCIATRDPSVMNFMEKAGI